MKTSFKFLLRFSFIIVSILVLEPALAQTITVQPTDQFICQAGESVNFTATVKKDKGQGNILSTNWQINKNDGNDWVDLTTPINQPNRADDTYIITYSIPSATSSDLNYLYRAAFKEGSSDIVYSASVKIINSTPPVTTTSGDTRTGSGVVTLKASGAPIGGSYKWYTVSTGGTAIAGETGSIYSPTLTANSTVTTTTFYVSAVYGNCEGPRSAVTATVYPESSPIIANDVITNMLLISSNDGQKAIDGLSASYPENTTSIPYTASYTIVTLPAPAQGILYVNGSAATANQVITTAQAKQLTFDPAPTFYGTASFTFKASDNQGKISSNTATYSIPVNAAPVANNVSSGNIPISNNTRVVIPILNATDADGNITSYTIVSLPSNATTRIGDLFLTPSGGTALTVGQIITTNQLYYEPTNTNNTATRTFTYRATDNKGVISNTATYSLFINSTPPPTANAVTAETISNSVTNAMSIKTLSATGGTSSYTYTITSLPASTTGTLYYLNNIITLTSGSYTLPAGGEANLRFAPNSSYSGITTFTYTATSTNGTSPNATYTIPVTYAPVANNVTSIVDPNTSVTIVPLAPLSATDQDGSITSFIIKTLPTNGLLKLYNNNVTVNQTLTPLEARELKFEKYPTFSDPVTFTYTAKDNMGVESPSQATFTIKKSPYPLPVTLVKFTAQAAKGGIELNWATASEINNDYFAIEQSQNGHNFEQIGKVTGAGNSNTRINYTYLDAAAPQGTIYYRLKQVDYNGKFEYSNIVAVTLKQVSAQDTKAYPNPFTKNMHVVIPVAEDGIVEIQLQNTNGKKVYSYTKMLKRGTHEIGLPLEHLSRGIYIVRITGDNLNQSLKVMKTK